MEANSGYVYAINLLSAALNEKSIPHNKHELYDGGQITFDWCGGDLICHYGSYGHEKLLYESMGLSGDEDDAIGNLTLEKAVQKVIDTMKEKGC